jgi:AraC family transcriptional regulator of adaptative response / DNA-3-methyladenine glycosylase II
MLEPSACHRALTARDARFDGLFFVGVTTTGIYCRPVCRAKTPRAERCRFFRTAAEAEHEGFRACFRCRPELAPGFARIDAAGRLVQRVIAQIEAGTLAEHTLEDVARELRVSSRYIRRAVTESLGVSPLELAQTRRLALAKQLLQDTSLAITEVAYASGFSSVRRFNALVRERLGRAPSEFRRAAAPNTEGTLVIRLDHRPPLEWQALLEFFARRQLPRVEAVAGDSYARTVRLGARRGWVRVWPRDAQSLNAEISLSLAPVLPQVVARLRRQFDLDAQPQVVSEHLRQDPALEPLVLERPGLRIPGAFDPFEICLRAVTGQQVSVAAGVTLMRRLTETYGEPFRTPREGLDLLFPSASRLSTAGSERLAKLGMPRARATTLHAVARAALLGRIRAEDPERSLEALSSIGGLGPWTRGYIEMRGFGAPDAFPEGDGVLRRVLGLGDVEMRERSDRWRPWRAYAALHLWTQEASK